MLTGKKIILFGAGIVGRRALNFFGAERVHCFVDNYKAGQMFWGKPVISFDELKALHSDYEVVISVGVGSYLDICKQCETVGVAYSMFQNLVSLDDYESNPEIAQFKDMYKGKRCFLIGNGPSLTPEDLTVLHERGELCFACNMISKIFDKTPWRPDYFFIADPLIYHERDMLLETEAKYKFLAAIEDMYIKEDATSLRMLLDQRGGNVKYYHFVHDYRETERPAFSQDASKAVCINGTVMYVMMQFAVYMGVSEMFLLGVDGTSFIPTDLGLYMSERRHFYDEYEDELLKLKEYFVQPDASVESIRAEKAYEAAEIYTRERGIRIYNTTRGGIVEAFERVDFDSLF